MYKYQLVPEEGGTLDQTVSDKTPFFLVRIPSADFLTKERANIKSRKNDVGRIKTIVGIKKEKELLFLLADVRGGMS